jgi:transaldolase
MEKNYNEEIKTPGFFVNLDWNKTIQKLSNDEAGQLLKNMCNYALDYTLIETTEIVETICEMVDGDISAEVISTDFAGIIEEGKKLVTIHKNIVVKVPMIKDGIKAIKWFTENKIRTNCTLVFSAGQAILAAKAGATYVSPFIGRVDDSGWDGMDLIHQMRQIFSVQGYRTEILAASIRNPNHIIKCAEAGADVCTCPLDSILGLLKHPLTDIGLAKFLEDAKKFA